MTEQQAREAERKAIVEWLNSKQSIFLRACQKGDVMFDRLIGVVGHLISNIERGEHQKGRE
jgi:hypothetical protein